MYICRKDSMFTSHLQEAIWPWCWHGSFYEAWILVPSFLPFFLPYDSTYTVVYNMDITWPVAHLRACKEHHDYIIWCLESTLPDTMYIKGISSIWTSAFWKQSVQKYYKWKSVVSWAVITIFVFFSFLTILFLSIVFISSNKFWIMTLNMDLFCFVFP